MIKERLVEYYARIEQLKIFLSSGHTAPKPIPLSGKVPILRLLLYSHAARGKIQRTSNEKKIVFRSFWKKGKEDMGQILIIHSSRLLLLLLFETLARAFSLCLFCFCLLDSTRFRFVVDKFCCLYSIDSARSVIISR